MAGTGLQPSVLVGSERHRLTIEGHVLDLKAENLGLSSSRQQEGGHERVDGLECAVRLGGSVAPRRVQEQRCLMHLEPGRFVVLGRGLVQERRHRVVAG